MSITIFKVSPLNGRSLGSVRRIATIGLWYIVVYLHLCLYLLQTHTAWWVEDLCNPDISCTVQTRPAWSMCSKTNIPTPWPVHSIAITLARPVTLYSCHNVLLNPSSCTVFISWHIIQYYMFQVIKCFRIVQGTMQTTEIWHNYKYDLNEIQCHNNSYGVSESPHLL